MVSPKMRHASVDVGTLCFVDVPEGSGKLPLGTKKH